MQILTIDDDAALCRSLQIHLEREGHTVFSAQTATEGLEIIQTEQLDLVFLDLQLPDINGIEVLRKIQHDGDGPLVVMITGTQDTKSTIEAVRLGAFDYIRKPLDLDVILLTLEKAEQRRSQLPGSAVASLIPHSDEGVEIVGATREIMQVVKDIGLLSQNRVPVLIEGESGTGKELVARVLHEASGADKPFVAINCSAIVPTLLESELFGHEKGAFTGAFEQKKGKLELAGEGTIFFDEIGEMSMDLQVKLLRALQELSFERVGGSETIPLKARIVAASNRDLKTLIAEQKFREDLYYRLAVSSILVPALRSRIADIPLLVNRLIGQIVKDLEKSVEGIEEGALEELQKHSWPGNIRELKNVLMRSVILTRDSVISKDTVSQALQGATPIMNDSSEAPRTLREVEKDHVAAILSYTRWNITHAAAILDISRVTLRKKIDDYALVPPSARQV